MLILLVACFNFLPTGIYLIVDISGGGCSVSSKLPAKILVFEVSWTMPATAASLARLLGLDIVLIAKI